MRRLLLRLEAMFRRARRSVVRLTLTRLTLALVLFLNVCVLSVVGYLGFASNAAAPVITRCSEFATWQAAADYWDAHRGEVRVRDGLDSNGNLIPCDTMVDRPGADLVPVDMRYVCDDFDYWEQAQSWFDAWVVRYPELVSLDRDGNGVACQGIPAHGDIVAVVKRLNRLERAGLR